MAQRRALAPRRQAGSAGSTVARKDPQSPESVSKDEGGGREADVADDEDEPDQRIAGVGEPRDDP